FRIVAGSPIADYVIEDVVDNILASNLREEVVKDHPLIMPANLLLGFGEGICGTDALRGELLHNGIMEAEEHNMKLPDDPVLVIAWITNERNTGVCRPGQITCRRQSKTEGALIVKVRLIGGAAPITRVQIKAWRSKIEEGIGIILTLEARLRIEGQIVI